MSQGSTSNLPLLARYAPVAKGVTYGDGHNHASGGDAVVVPIAGGGTGVTTVAGARSSLALLQGSVFLSGSRSTAGMSQGVPASMVAVNTLAIGMYLVEAYWDSNGSGTPWLVGSSWLIPIITVNGTAASPLWNPIGMVDHQFLGGANIIALTPAGGTNVICGVNVQLNFPIPGGTIYYNFYKLG